LCGDADLYDHLKQFVGRRVKGHGNAILRETVHTKQAGSVSGASVNAAAMHGRTLQIQSSAPSPTYDGTTLQATTMATFLETSASTDVTAARRVFSDDVIVMSQVSMLDSRNSDSRSGIVEGAVTPLLGRNVSVRITGSSSDIDYASAVGADLQTHEMERFHIHDKYHMISSGPDKITVTSEYLGSNTAHISTDKGRNNVHHTTPGTAVIAAGTQIVVLNERVNLYQTLVAQPITQAVTDTNAPYLSTAEGGKVSITLRGTAAAVGNVISLHGLGQDGVRCTMALMTAKTTSVDTFTLHGVAPDGFRLCAAFVMSTGQFTLEGSSGFLETGSASRTHQMCVLRLSGMTGTSPVYFEGRSLVIGPPPEGSMISDESEICPDTIVRDFKMRQRKVHSTYVETPEEAEMKLS
jgi:hypothetical protein